jgi:hypothetical protein
MRGRAVHRALLLGAAIVALAAGLFGCGGGDGGDSTTDKDADVRVLNEILGRQQAAVEAYGQALPALQGADLTIARHFRAQEQEHVNETMKTLRGLDGEADPREEAIEAPEFKMPADAFEFLYELESATLDAELNAVRELTIPWPRPVIAQMAANQAQRLVLIRRALGAGPLESVPEAFETGDIAAPEQIVEP